ncbi:MAG: chorismate mutase, partial [Gammaproteobacteria bacterium]|nr:chorismate mutase [Gammaproteobacteria bacterium]
KEDINLHRIETRPSRQTTDSHNFFIDCEGHNQDKKLRKVIDEIRKKGAFVRILGSYPLET